MNDHRDFARFLLPWDRWLFRLYVRLVPRPRPTWHVLALYSAILVVLLVAFVIIIC